MPDSVKVDDDQLRKVLEAFQARPHPKWTLEKTLILVQLFAIIIGGCWALLGYISFQREHNELILDGMKFADSQQEILLEQQQLTKEQTRLNIQSQRATVDLANIELGNAIADRLAHREIIFEVNNINTYDDYSCLYEVFFKVVVENISSEQFEITWMVNTYHIGTIVGDEVEKHTVIKLNDAPSIWQEYSGTTASDSEYLQWKRVGYYAAECINSDYSQEAKRIFSCSGCDRIDQGGGLTSLVYPGEKVGYGCSHLVRADPDDYISFKMHIGIDGGAESEKTWIFKRTAYLADILPE